MARKRDRAFAAFGATLFLITSSALTIAVIVTLVSQHNAKPSKPSSTANTACNPSSASSPPTKLTGTKMQNFSPTNQPQTQLQTIDIKVGTGDTVKQGACITADYVGALMTTGVIFDASSDHGGPQTFSLSGVIAGWTQGIPGMKIGGTRRLLIPAALAYGAQGAGNSIPPNSDLVFDVTLVSIN